MILEEITFAFLYLKSLLHLFNDEKFAFLKYSCVALEDMSFVFAKCSLSSQM